MYCVKQIGILFRSTIDKKSRLFIEKILFLGVDLVVKGTYIRYLVFVPVLGNFTSYRLLAQFGGLNFFLGKCYGSSSILVVCRFESYSFDRSPLSLSGHR